MTEKFLYKYKVVYYNEVDDIMAEESGVLFADEHIDAAKQVIDYYGEKQIDSFTLSVFDIPYLLPVYTKELGAKGGYKETDDYKQIYNEFAEEREKD
jgi:hypothetical protein